MLNLYKMKKQFTVTFTDNGREMNTQINGSGFNSIEIVGLLEQLKFTILREQEEKGGKK